MAYRIILVLLATSAFAFADEYFYGYTGDGSVPPSPDWMHDAVFYSLNVQHFGKTQTKGSYFDKAAAELEYVKELGANTVVINPVQEFVANMPKAYWNGYYLKDPTAISDVYGGGRDFKKFVDKAHSLGLKVIVDVVVRHVYADGPEAKKLLAQGKHDWFVPGLTKEQLEVPFRGDTVGAYNAEKGEFVFLSFDSSAVSEVNNQKKYHFIKSDAAAKTVTGDWDGDGRDSVGVRQPDGTFLLGGIARASQVSQVEHIFKFGPAGEHIIPIAGDWDGDGKDTLGIYDPQTGTFFIKNSLAPGKADATFNGLRAGMVPLAGDWDGDGRDTLGEYDPNSGKFYHYDSKGELVTQAYRFGSVGEYTAVSGDWNDDGKNGIALVKDAHPQYGYGHRFIYIYKNKISGGAADGTFELNLPAGYNDCAIAGNFDYNAQRTPSILFGGTCYHYKWDNEDLQEYMIDLWVDLVRKFDFDGYRLDLEAYQTVLVPFGNQNIWKRVIEKCYNDFDKKILIISEMDGMGNNNIHAEQDTFGVLTNLHWDPAGKKRNFMVNANIVDTAKTLENTYYTMTLSCHDHAEFQAQGRRSTFGYMVFSPFMPWWRMGEEINALNLAPTAGTTDYGYVLYFSDMDWDSLKEPEKKAFYEDVRRMLQLREEYKDIISPFCSKFKDRNFTAIPAEGCKLQVYANYGSGIAIIVAAKLDESDGDVTLNIDSQKLAEMGLGDFEKFRVTEKLYRPNESRVLSKSQLSELCQYVENNNVVFMVIEGLK
ncbi:putative oligo-1,6-glucosidase 2 [Limihaloglobus sulfuriphilus]|uniref:Putative oligo-1,6-glucosidase 2 n=1 Tax=Limihaloglobus sulfuriphilus TaxID=1851148 RepID=A0A1Q2MDJ1_9BACT|nr:alpha-amylase family glycosyl hydrolase [Limihaloglobus sulfuriphilus]AQQ70332.1 putative oligo-1,6-glucosidase 2 [Limihaloglobus sulfuriphilus]